MTEEKKINNDKLNNVTGGTAFTAGTPEERKMWECPSHHANAYKTGKEEEASHWIFWSRHMKEYYCPDCDHYFWKHED